ncbi:MAG: dipeptidase [Planctomycetota bacterium]|jgi:acetylornithine deacetylase/succinyl-diaminopimelate desuccinylase-like protein
MESILKYIEQNRQSFMDQLEELLKFPSISADSAYKKDLKDCADHLVRKLESLGLKAERIETAGHPIVYGEYHAPENKHTLLLYGHYDVQPVDPLDLWDHPPFEPHIEQDTIYARGATDDKGQLMTHLLAIEAYMKTRGSLPVNLKILIEGEEETASENLDTFIQDNKDKLAAEVVVVSDSAMYQRGIPAITYGLRGIAVGEIRIQGPGKDLHSGGFGGAVANPAAEMAHIVAAFHGADGRVRIDGFYDKVKELEGWEREMFASLPYDEAAFLKTTGSPAVLGEEGYTTLERLWARPTCEVNGIFGGYQGEGGKTIVPAWAGCKMTMRLVPDQEPNEILEKFERFVKKTASPAVKVEVTCSGGAKPALVSRESPFIQAGTRAMEKGFGKTPVFIRCGGSIPVVNVFKEVLGLDTLLLGFGQEDDNAHSPNEKFSLSDFHQGIVTMAHLFEEMNT